MLYDTLSSAKSRVIYLCDIQPSEVDNIIFAEELLEITKGEFENLTVCYRPFISAAMYLMRDLDTQAIKEADNVVFTNQLETIKNLLSMQSSFDLANNLIIPEGMDADKVLETLVDPISNNPIISIMTV